MPAYCPRLIYHKDPDQLVRRVFDELGQHQSAWPDHRAFILVPEYLKADMERRYLTSQQAGGLMMAEVLSFRRLATRLFMEAGRQAAGSLSKAGKAVLAQGLLLDSSLPFRRFNRLAGRPRYAAELVSVLGDFQRYGISTKDLMNTEEAIGSAVASRATIDKLHDFALLKDALEKELQQRQLDDPDEELSRLAHLLGTEPLPGRLAFLRHSHVWILGFGNSRDFTSQERKVLKALSSKVASLTIAVADDGSEGEEIAFRHGSETLRSLERLFPGSKKEPLASPDTRAQAEMHFIRAIDRREEVRFVAGEIRRLLLMGKLRRKDIGIALCETDMASSYLEPALTEYGIDACIDTGRPLHHSSFLRFLRSFLKLCKHDFSLDDLLNYYRSGLSGLDRQWIDLFENAALAAGWRGVRDSSRILGRLDPLTPDGLAVTSVLADLEKLLEQTTAMREAGTGKSKCALLIDLLFEGDRPPAQLIEKQRDRLLADGHKESARILVASWNAAIDYLEESSGLLGETRISQEHFSSLLLAGMEGLSLASIPAGIDLVRGGSLAQMASWPCRVLFILGATDAAFPPPPRQEGYLLDEERAFLADRSGKPFPNRKKDQAASQAWLIHSLLARPDQSLYLSAPTLGDDSSRLFDEWLSEKGGDEIILTKQNARPDARWYAPEAAVKMLRWNRDAPLAWQEAVAHFKKDIPRLLQPADVMAGSFVLPEPLVETVMTERDGISVSLIQLYNSCPFRFFIEYLTGAAERTIPDDMASHQGTLLHRLMELAVEELIGLLRDSAQDEKTAVTLGWQKQLTPPYMRNLYRQAAEDRQLVWYGQPPLSGGIGERMIMRAADTLGILAEFNREDEFRPHLLEWYFPQEGRPPYQLTAGKHNFTCRGLIDRIDENPQGLLRLIDYKRSSREFSWLGLYDGTDLQLPLYQRAYETAFPGSLIEGLLFAGWKTSNHYELSSFQPPPSPGENTGLGSLKKQMAVWKEDHLQKVAHFAEKKAVESLESILSGHFPAKPVVREGSQNPCTYCPWYAACGYDSRLARNRTKAADKEENSRVREAILEAGS
ncbi:MAG: hypothetical protein GX838_02270 [Clostridiaceae bacterium]|nr:hypothetical protein [Clostridiaceae bacterium]